MGAMKRSSGVNWRWPTAALLLATLTLLGCAPQEPSPTPTSGVPLPPTHTPLPPAMTPLPTAAGARSIPECLQGATGCAVIAPGQTIKIGMAGPMTGGFSAFGQDIFDAGRLATEAFGQYLDWKFELVQGDTQGDPANAPAVADAWVADPTVVAIAGHIFSGETLAAMPIYEAAAIPMMSPSATNPDLTQSGSDVFNRVAFTDVVQAANAAGYLYNTLGVRRLVIVDDAESYGQGLAQIVDDQFAALGGQVLFTDELSAGSADLDTELAAEVARIIEVAPGAIYYGGYDDVAIRVVNALGPDSGIVFFGCDGTFGANFLANTGANGEGTYAASLAPPVSAAGTVFGAQFRARFGVAPGVRSPYTWQGYDAVGVLIAAVKRVAIIGDDGNLYVPRAALVRAVRGTKDYPGLSGSITCDQIGECSTSGPSFYVIRNGEWVPAS